MLDVAQHRGVTLAQVIAGPDVTLPDPEPINEPDPAPDRLVNQQEPHVIASQQTTARPAAVVPQQRAPRTAPARATAPTPAPTPVPVPTTVPAGVNERKASAPQVELLAELPTGLLMRFNGTLHLAQPADVVPLYVTKPGLLR